MSDVCAVSVCAHTQSHKHESSRDTKGQRVALLMGVNPTLLSWNHTHTHTHAFNQCVMLLF